MGARLVGASLLAILPAHAAQAAPDAGPRFVQPATTAVETLRILDARLALMDGVAAAKWQSGAPILDPVREQQVLEQVVRLAGERGLEAASARAVFSLQMQLARDWQIRLHQAWRGQGGPPPGTPVPDLAKQVRPQLDALTAQQLELFARDHADWSEPTTLRDAFDAHRNEFPFLAKVPEADRQGLWSALSALRNAPGRTLQRIRATGTLRVGLTGDYAPFSLEQETGLLEGTDVVLAERLADSLAGDGLLGGAHVRYVRTTWRTLLPDLLAGRFDVALGGISITVDRSAQAAFSPPYHHGGKTFLARCADGDRYATLAAADRSSVRLLVNPGGTNERFVRANFHQATIRVLPDNRAVFGALVRKEGDLMVTDDVEVALQTRLHPTLCRATSLLFEPADKAVMLVRDAELESAVRTWMDEEVRNGVPALLLDQALRAASSEN